MNTPEAPRDAPCGELADRRPDALPWPALVALGLLPAFQTTVAVYLEFYPYLTYPLLKGLMLLAPVAVWVFARRPLGRILRDIGVRNGPTRRGLFLGLGFAAVILAVHYSAVRWLVDPGPILEKVDRLALGGPAAFLGLAAVISFANSLFEEYYWRGFLLDQWAQRFDNGTPGGTEPGPRASFWPCAWSAGFFGVHHVVVLLPLVPWFLAVGGALVTVAAGFVWCRLRMKGWSLWDCYVSHILADLAVLWAGWDLMTMAS